MSHQTRLGEWLSGHRIDLTLARVGLVASLLLFGLQLLASAVFLLAIPVATGSACALYLALGYARDHAVGLPTLPRSVGGYLPAVVYAGLAALVVLVATAGTRTRWAYLLTGALGTVLFVQILALDDDQLSARSLLPQILAVAVVVRLSALLVTPGFVGVDIWTHVPEFVGGIVEAGSLSAIAGTKYSMAPLYHAYGAVATLVIGSPRMAVYLTLGLVVPLSALFVYGTGRLLVSTRWALLATALYAFADQFVRWGMHIIPTSLGLVFFLGVVYFVTRLYLAGPERWSILGLTSFTFAVVFTHQVSTAVLLVVLGIAAVVAVVTHRVGPPVASAHSGGIARTLASVFVLVTAVTIYVWSRTPWTNDTVFLDRMLRSTREVVTQQAGFLNLAGVDGGGGSGAAALPPGPSSSLSPYVPYIDVVGFTILLTVGVLGGLRMLRRRDTALSAWYVLAAAAMFVVIFGFSLFGIRLFLPGRWMAFLYAPMVVMGALAVRGLTRRGSRGVVVAVVVLLALVYPASMVVAQKATLDSPVFEDEFTRFAYTEAEIGAVDTISRVRGPAVQEDVRTDHPYFTLFNRRGGYEADTLVLGEQGPADPIPVVYRNYQSTGPATFQLPGEPPRTDTQANVAPSTVCPPAWHHVYTSDEVRFCTPPEGSS